MNQEELFQNRWRPQGDPRGAVAIVHGLGEHSSRYECLAQRFVERGYAVVSVDLPGHGKSPGPRGHSTYTELLECVEWLHHEGIRMAGSGTTILYGHSFGGNLAVNYVLRRQPALEGLVLTSPLFRPARQPPVWKRLSGRLLSRTWPTVTFATGVRPEQLSHDELAVERCRRDPLIHHQVSAQLGTETLDAGRWALLHAHQLNVPTLVMHGRSDVVTSAEASVEFARRVGDGCEIRLWDGLFHELHHEREREAVTGAILDWLYRLDRYRSPEPLPASSCPSLEAPIGESATKARRNPRD